MWRNHSKSNYFFLVTFWPHNFWNIRPQIAFCIINEDERSWSPLDSRFNFSSFVSGYPTDPNFYPLGREIEKIMKLHIFVLIFETNYMLFNNVLWFTVHTCKYLKDFSQWKWITGVFVCCKHLTVANSNVIWLGWSSSLLKKVLKKVFFKRPTNPNFFSP